MPAYHRHQSPEDKAAAREDELREIVWTLIHGLSLDITDAGFRERFTPTQLATIEDVMAFDEPW